MAGVVSGEGVRRFLERDTGNTSGYKIHAQDCVVTRVGGNPLNEHYGAWYLCEGFSSRPFTLISVGSGCDSTFEHDFARKSPDSMIHVFDPTINHARFHDCSQKSVDILGLNSQKRDNQIKFWELGLSAAPKVVSFFKSRNAKISSLSEVEVRGYHRSRNYGTVLDVNSIIGIAEFWEPNNPVILKMDIEGSEFDTIHSWCATKRPPEKLWKVDQLTVEFHSRFLFNGSAQQDSAINCLASLGFVKVYEHSPKKEEMLFVRY